MYLFEGSCSHTPDPSGAASRTLRETRQGRMYHKGIELAVILVIIFKELTSNHFLIKTSLRLPTKDLRSSCENDDEPIARVSCTRDDPGKVGRLSTLNVSNNKAFRLIGLRLRRVR